MESMVIPLFPHAHLIIVAQMKLQILYWLFETYLDVFYLTKHVFYLIKHVFFGVKTEDEGRSRSTLGYWLQDKAVLGEGSIGLAALLPLFEQY